jgi:hypothetical protein
MITYTGHLPITREPITSSARCIVYDHKRELVYLSTHDRQLARNVVRIQQRRDPKGDYKAYELIDDAWCEIQGRQARPTAWANPPFFPSL